MRRAARRRSPCSEIARLAARQPDELTGTFLVAADDAQLNQLLGETMERLEATWRDVTASVEVDGEPVDVPGPKPHEALDGDAFELTLYPPRGTAGARSPRGGVGQGRSRGQGSA